MGTYCSPRNDEEMSVTMVSIPSVCIMLLSGLVAKCEREQLFCKSQSGSLLLWSSTCRAYQIIG